MPGAFRGARTGHHPPRHQAAEHHGAARRQREGHGLRHRAREEFRHDPNLLGAGHGSLHLPRAGAGQGPHRHQRHLLVGHRAVRVGHGALAVRRTRCRERGHEAGQRPARAAARDQPRYRSRARGHHHEGHREEPGRPLRHREGHAPRAERLPGRTARQPGRRLHQRRDRGHGRRGAPRRRGRRHGRHARDGRRQPRIPHRGAALLQREQHQREEEQQEDHRHRHRHHCGACRGGRHRVRPHVGQRERQRQGRRSQRGRPDGGSGHDRHRGSRLRAGQGGGVVRRQGRIRQGDQPGSEGRQQAGQGHQDQPHRVEGRARDHRARSDGHDLRSSAESAHGQRVEVRQGSRRVLRHR